MDRGVAVNPASERLFSEAFLRRLEQMALIFRGAARSQMQGERRSARRGQSVEFSDFRPYTLGDDFRRIDWNAYARLERLFIKLFVEEEEIILHLLIDNSPSMDWGEPNKLKFAQRVAAAIGYISLVGVDRVSVSAIYDSRPGSQPNNHASGFFSPVRGKNSAIRLFSFLQSISASPASQVPSSRLNSIASGIHQPGVVLIFSDLFGDAWQPAVSRLLGHGHEISILHLLSPEEIAPDLSGDFRLVDAESRAQVEITADFETIQRYRAHLEAWQASWRRFCSARQIAYLPISSATPLEDLLFASLPKHGVLR